MINSNQLRVGNYIAHQDHAFKVISIQERFIGLEVSGAYGAEVPIDNINPIPIHPKLFGNLPHNVYSNDHFEVLAETRTFIFKRYNDLCWNINQKVNDMESFPLTTLCFLHQFQNLVEILTNKDLDIQL